MALNFPNSPSLNDQYTFDGKTFTYDGTKWVVESTDQTFVDSAAPVSPTNGDLWFDASDGSLNIYYDDGNTAQWVSTSGSTVIGTLDTITDEGSTTTNGITVGSLTSNGFILADSATVTNGLTAGSLVASSLTYPTSDGTSGQAIVTNGSGTLTFSDAGISTGKAIAMAIVFG